MGVKKGLLISDVALASGVSTATVDRVLNKRPGVHRRTEEKVLSVAVSLGYLPENEMADLLRPKPISVVFLLPAGTNPYLRLLGNTVKQEVESLKNKNIRARCFFIDSFDPDRLAESLSYYGKRADGIAFMAIDHPKVREAVSNLDAKGKYVITMVSDVPCPGRRTFVGLDNRSVGRTAGYFMGRFLGHEKGVVALITASRIYRAHGEREIGFLEVMEKDFPDIQVVAASEGHDDRDENYRHTARLLRDHKDLAGIYNVGGSSDGIARALQRHGRERQVIFIGHGLTVDTRASLVNEIMDVVITQSPQRIIEAVIGVFENLRVGESVAQYQNALSMEIITKENLP